MKEILQYIFRPLVSLLELDDNGQELFQYLYFTRSGVEEKIEAALKGKHNIVFVSNPGNGKTTCMHFMFIEFQKDKRYHPIILDFKNIAVKSEDSMAKAMLCVFISEMKEYFKIIGKPITSITEKATLQNCEDQALLIRRHLRNCTLEELKENKLIIFLDDLDYAEKHYMKILKEYFMPYMHTDKSTVILSVRPMLHNMIKTHDPLRQYFYTLPREVLLPQDDLQFIIHNRIKSIVNIQEAKNILQKFIQVFRSPTKDQLIYNRLKEIDPDFKGLDDILPFDKSFYSRLQDITLSNLRRVEELLPDLIEYQLSGQQPCLNTDFYSCYIKLTHQKKNIMPDLVSEKTSHQGKTKNNNSITQIVLEYFYFQTIVNERMYKILAKYGINKEQANSAIKRLSTTPCSMLTADYQFERLEDESSEIKKAYNINIKGVKFVENILRHDLYYALKGIERTNRSYYHDKLNP